MVFEGEITGKFVRLRSIDVKDAEFSYAIRNMDGIRGLVGIAVDDVETQVNYIESQRQKEGDYYFVVETLLGEKVGLYGIYDIKGKSAELGREANIGQPYEAIEAEILALEFARDELGIEEVCFYIYPENKRQLSMAKKHGHISKGIVERNGRSYYEFSRNLDEMIDSYSEIRKLIDRIAGRNNDQKM